MFKNSYDTISVTSKGALMEIGNQQGRLLFVKYNALMLEGIDLSKEFRKGFTPSDTLKFILNINQEYEYFLKEFGLHKDQVKRTKKKVFDIYQTIIPKGFRPVVGFDKYIVNEFGVVVNKRTRAILRSSLNHKGYPTVCLTDKATETVHRIVATAWIPNPYEKPEVNHIDGNKLHNFTSNLEWNTKAENIEHKKLNHLGKTRKAQVAATGQNNSQAKLSPRDVLEIRASSDSSSILSTVYNVSQHTINDIKARRSWKHI